MGEPTKQYIPHRRYELPFALRRHAQRNTEF
jgi:hypothetical protein